MMSGAQARAHLTLLGLSQVDAAELLGTNARTVRRWVDADNEEIPGPAEQALRAWARLHRAGWAWRPDHQALAGADHTVQATRRLAAHAVSDALERVRRRGGAVALWDVDLRRQRATLGAMQLHFQRLEGGGFVPQSYRRNDDAPHQGDPEIDSAHAVDLARDAALLEDGYACIARALSRAERAVGPPLRLAPAVVVFDRLILWEDCPVPTVVLVIAGAVARAVLGPFISLEEVRVVASGHTPELTGLAQQLASEVGGEINSLGVRELVLDETQLRRVGLTRPQPRSVQGSAPLVLQELRACGVDLIGPMR